MNYIQLAYRNILRHGKRSFVTIMTICLGFVAIGVMNGMISNIYSRLSGQAIVVEKLGHITFAKQGYFENHKMDPESYLWEKDEMEGILKLLKDDSNVKLATPRLSLFGIVSNGAASTIFLTEAVVPEDDQLLLRTDIDGRQRTRGAVTLTSDKNSDVALGEELARNLGLAKNGQLTLLTSTKSGMANAVDADIAEVYNTGNPATNDKFMITDFSLAQELYDTEGAERIVVVLNEGLDAAAERDRIIDKLSIAGYSTEAKTWNELSMFYEKITGMFGVIFRVLTAIITVVVLLTLMNTMQMSVNERTREIGTMRAIGMPRSNVVKLFCLEGLVMAVLGCAIALPILIMISELLAFLKITFIPPIASSPVPIVLMLYAKSIAIVFLIFCVAALISSYSVSRKIAYQKVIDSLIKIN